LPRQEPVGIERRIGYGDDLINIDRVMEEAAEP
jgi:hypothetical protein